VPKVNPSVYIEPRIIEAVHRAVNVPLKDVVAAKTNGAKNGYSNKSNVGGSDEEDEGEILDEEVAMD
jgi:hypothetical protein